MPTEVLRYAAFTSEDGRGGNPAGVVLDAGGLDEAAMQSIAADLGYSETAFLFPREHEPNVYDVRYFAPEQEVPFCGHATIASGVALVERRPAEELVFHTPAGLVTVSTQRTDHGLVAELTSVSPRVRPAPPELVESVLGALHWSSDDLDPDYPPALANAGSEHLVLVTRTRARLADLHYDYDALAQIMRRQGLITVLLAWPEGRKLYHARNPFAGSGVVEDPATGAAAAAFGGYLRELHKIGPTADLTILQGAEMGRPSRIEVSVQRGEPGVRVRGAASAISA
ncbi:PhzF family phenazine biosynthesis protein [Microlunatus flavus]|uniref:Phenazine biosynthesis protein PhzF family n=1 Tax=Microlunatus flavus TaxID=1036181 RepID=A0A1H9HPI4_9ACTN|nr:PhzF family phenazine biosynthesis isomerase [Microlunatus flavus]SEQ64176.1 phenazine biosynthesis protein PhzF family [Microlunatus flavus]